MNFEQKTFWNQFNENWITFYIFILRYTRVHTRVSCRNLQLLRNYEEYYKILEFTNFYRFLIRCPLILQNNCPKNVTIFFFENLTQNVTIRGHRLYSSDFRTVAKNVKKCNVFFRKFDKKSQNSPGVTVWQSLLYLFIQHLDCGPKFLEQNSISIIFY